ncbi:M48 family metallopeptidase [Bacillus sp. RG28]|uniref:M48 family metallopeptidase n=2 Tax=Gottfriedia endophytica TaxID=2820819 RepID=A0A940NN87_9BACI|nr:M48 family metallopeptidase [Gottfriedia endophytica]
MKKVNKYILYGYLIYIAFILCYFYVFTNPSIPVTLKGTVMDPSTFMNKKQLEISTTYSTIKNVIYFISLPFDWFVFLWIISSGFAKRTGERLEKLTKFRSIQILLFFFFVSISTYLVTYPVDVIRFFLSKHYHINTQTFPSWMKDQVIDFWVNFIIMYLVVYVVLWLMKKRPKRWWFTVWLLSIPFTVFLTFIQPVVIDPLYNQFYPLKDKALEKEIMTLAHKANIPAKRVYEVDMSTKTTTYNAYVTGIGNNARIVLWDTTINGLKDDEILFIMAHEMSHYIKKDIYTSMFGGIAGSLIGLYLIDWLIRRVYKNRNAYEKVTMVHLTLFLLFSSLLSFAATPIENAISRHAEKVADLYAVKLTKDPEAGVTAFQKLTENSLTQVNPPGLVKFFRYDHPTMLERITYIENAVPQKK